MILNLFTDGGSRGNPGLAGYGFVVYDVSKLPVDAPPKENLPADRHGAGIVLEKCGNYLGTQTNNQAEYEGLEAGVAWVLEYHPEAELNIVMDSLLIVNQIKGVYRIKHPMLAPYHRRIMAILRQISKYSIQHVRREYNTVADSLANEAMDNHLLG